MFEMEKLLIMWTGN